MGMKAYVEKTKTVVYTFLAGAVVGSLYHGFGHIRRLYSDDYKQRRKEMDLLKHEDADKLKARLVIGGMIGAAAGILLGIAVARSSDDEPDEE